MLMLHRSSAFLFVFALQIGATCGDDRTFYTRREHAMGIEIKAPRAVSPDALKVANRAATIMLRARPDIAKRMKDLKAAIGIIPRNAFITVLPEYSNLSGKKDSNGNPYDSFKIRGAGAVPGQPVTATSEENLLRLKGDPFAAESVTCHEFAHAIMNLGFTAKDKQRWTVIYSNAKQRNLFPGTFAMTNADEYWAELSQSYFGVNNEINSPVLISHQDPDAFHFLESVYGKAKRTEHQRNPRRVRP